MLFQGPVTFLMNRGPCGSLFNMTFWGALSTLLFWHSKYLPRPQPSTSVGRRDQIPGRKGKLLDAFRCNQSPSFFFLSLMLLRGLFDFFFSSFFAWLRAVKLHTQSPRNMLHLSLSSVDRSKSLRAAEKKKQQYSTEIAFHIIIVSARIPNDLI